MIVTFVAADDADLKELTLLFDNLDLIFQHQEEILTNPDYYNIPLKGCGVFALYCGSCRLRLGDMLHLWSNTEWRKGDVYNFSIVGSPLSGGNSCRAWSKSRGFFSRHNPTFSGMGFPAWEVKRLHQSEPCSSLTICDLLANINTTPVYQDK